MTPPRGSARTVAAVALAALGAARRCVVRLGAVRRCVVRLGAVRRRVVRLGVVCLGVACLGVAHLGVAHLVPGTVAPAGAQQLDAADLVQQVGIDQNQGATLPAELVFADAEGRRVRLGDLFGGRPVILALVYYECPMLCTVTVEGLLGALRPLNLTLGEDFDVVTVSIDPGETAAVAATKKAEYLEEYGRHHPDATGGWHALTGDAEAIAELADVVGFRYVYDERRDMYAHAAGIVVATPDRRLARYFYGVTYPTRDLRLALVEASDGSVGNLADQVLLLCYRYDPAKGKYGFVVWGAIRLLGVATVLALAAFIIVMLRRERSDGPDDGGHTTAAPAATGTGSATRTDAKAGDGPTGGTRDG